MASRWSTIYRWFHRLWGKAVDQPGYNKREWMILQAKLDDLKRQCPDSQDDEESTKPGRRAP